MAQDRELEVDLILMANGEATSLGVVTVLEGSLRSGESVWHDGTEYELTHFRPAVHEMKRPQALCVRSQAPAVTNPILRFVIGQRFMEKDGFRIFHGNRELTSLFDVKSLKFEVDADARGRKQMTRVHLELLAEVEVEGETEIVAQMEVMPVPLCARCSLPTNVHGHGETGREDSHPFVAIMPVNVVKHGSAFLNAATRAAVEALALVTFDHERYGALEDETMAKVARAERLLEFAEQEGAALETERGFAATMPLRTNAQPDGPQIEPKVWLNEQQIGGPGISANENAPASEAAGERVGDTEPPQSEDVLLRDWPPL